MTDNEIISEMAQQDGWTVEEVERNISTLRTHFNYCENMALVLGVLSKTEFYHSKFVNNLWKEIGNGNFQKSKKDWDYSDVMDILYVTPRQVCSAFLKTIGRWKE